MNNFICSVVSFIVFTLIMFAVIWVGTSPEHWYSGQHDERCEKMLYDSENCFCCQRLIESEKNTKSK